MRTPQPAKPWGERERSSSSPDLASQSQRVAHPPRTLCASSHGSPTALSSRPPAACATNWALLSICSAAWEGEGRGGNSGACHSFGAVHRTGPAVGELWHKRPKHWLGHPGTAPADNMLGYKTL